MKIFITIEAKKFKYVVNVQIYCFQVKEARPTLAFEFNAQPPQGTEDLTEARYISEVYQLRNFQSGFEKWFHLLSNQRVVTI